PWDIEAVRTVYETGVTSTRANAPPLPQNLVATATSETTIHISWSASLGAVTYDLVRSTNNRTFTVIASIAGTSYTDTNRTPGTTYVYRVRARNLKASSAYSHRDHATTVIFVDDPLVAGVTQIKAIHLIQLRQAVNAVRVGAGFTPVTWTDSSPAGVEVKALHINQLRNALTPALNALGKPATYTDTITPGDPIRAIHFQELRNKTK
ncbi:MAG: fibronectin type III domain-containing protein, partial [Thermoanaerobaculia bacterium]